MPPGSSFAWGPQDYNQAFLAAPKYVDPTIQSQQFVRRSLWRQRIGRREFMLGQGQTKSFHRWHPGIGDQAALDKWHAVSLSKVTGDTVDYDACGYNPYVVNYGAETFEYSGLRTSRRTNPICLNDIKYTWQYNTQLGLAFNFLTDVTFDIQENYAREQYINFCIMNGNGFVMSNGRVNSYQIEYNPFSRDADGDSTMKIPKVKVSTLNWRPLRQLTTRLGLRAAGAEMANIDGRPHFGLVINADEVIDMIEGDPNLREDYRFASPRTLVPRIGSVKQFKGYSIWHDEFEPRFSIKQEITEAATQKLVLKREEPYEEVAASTLGVKQDVRDDYLYAPYAMAIIFLNKVYDIEVPMAGPRRPGGGTQFGAVPGLNGDFRWLNIQDPVTNPLNEIGHFFSRYEYYAKPNRFSDECICLIYKRCPESVLTECGVGGTEAVEGPVNVPAGDAGDWSVTVANVSGSDYTCTVALSEIINREHNESVVVTADGTDYDAIISDHGAAPTYTLLFATKSDRDAVTAATASMVIDW